MSENGYRNKDDFFRDLEKSYSQIHMINDSGGGGEIYEAIHKRLNQKVILKKIRSDKLNAIGVRRETDILMNLKHTYLPRILDFWSYGNDVFTVMEFIEGKSFQELLNEGVVFQEKDVIRWTRQLAEVLEYLHRSPAHVIHGDIKPANLMLTPQNNICLIDFNVSVLQGGEMGEAIGYSSGYSPAEQLIQFEVRRQERASGGSAQERAAAYLGGQSADSRGRGRGAGSNPGAAEILRGAGTDADATEILRGAGSDADATEILRGAGSDADATEILRGAGSDADATEILGGAGTDPDATEILRDAGTDPDATEILQGAGTDPDATEILGGAGTDPDATEILRDAGTDPDATEILGSAGADAAAFTQNGVRGTDAARNPGSSAGSPRKGTAVSAGKPDAGKARPVRYRSWTEGAALMIKKYGKKLQMDERSDIYSACATMYHLLTGQKPAPCYEKQVPVEKLMPTVNDAFAHILMHGMEQDPKKRFKNSTQLLNAMKQMVKSTKRYKHLLWKQDFVLVLVLVLFLGSAGAAYVGWGMRNEESLTAQLETASDSYHAGRYQETIDYLEANVLNNLLYQESDRMSEGYYLNGSCHLELGEYDEAITEFRKAILLDSSQSLYYRDYGIALARAGNLEQARESLLQAQAKGLTDDSTLLLQGEIASLEGDYDGAVKYLKSCLESTEDDMIRMHAYVKLDQVLEERGGDDAYEERIGILEEASRKLPKERSLLILERLAQACGDYGQLTGEESYTQKAIDALDEIIGLGYGTLVERLDQAVFYQSLSRYEEAKTCLLEADKAYPDNYLVYKRLAFLEIEIQAALESDSRDYQEFESYFQKADALYQAQGPDREQDLEMEYLYQVYDEVAVKGWLGR